MTTVNTNEMLAPSFTMLDAAKAVFAQILADHHSQPDVDTLCYDSAFASLMDSCKFLPDAMRAGIPDEPSQDPAQTAEDVISWLKEDLYSEQLASLNKAVITIANEHQGKCRHDFVEATLERIRVAVDAIEQSDDLTKRNRANAHVSDVICEVATKFGKATHLVSLMHISAAKLENSDDPLNYSTENQRHQELILVQLKRLAFLLGKDQWATAHGFQKPTVE